MSILDGVFFTNIKLICWNINKITLLTSYIYIYICYIHKKKGVSPALCIYNC